MTLRPNWVTAYTGKDPYRPKAKVTIDGVLTHANGYDQPWLVNDSAEPWTAEDLGGSPPGEGEHTANIIALALDAGGTYLANGESATYYATLRNDRLGRETAPQSVSITNSSGGARQVIATWSDTGLEAWWTHVVLYRRFKDASGFRKIAKIAVATGTYTDDTTWAALESADAYLPRYRRTPPPIFKGMVWFAGRLMGWTGDDEALWYGQLPDTLTGEFLSDDFYGSEQIGAADGYGAIVAAVEHDGFLYIFKRRAIYIVEGDDPSNWVVRRMHAQRGTVSWQTVIQVREYFAFLDIDGLLLWTPGGEPVMAGASESNFSPLEERWNQMNLAAADNFTGVFHEETGEIELHIAIDGWPVLNRRIIFSTNEGVFTADDDEVYATQVGYLEDGAGGRHLCRGDEISFLWEEYVGTSEGIASGGTVFTITTGATATDWPTVEDTIVAGINGPTGTPIDLRQDDGTTLRATNRVYSAAVSLIRPLYWSATTPAEDDVVVVGVIPYVVETPPRNGGTVQDKRFLRTFLTFEAESSGNEVLVETQTDRGSWTTIASALDLALTKPKVIDLTDLGCVWAIRVTQRDPDTHVAWTSLDVQTVETGTWGNQ